MTLEELLFKTYGYSEFRPGQKEIISEVLNGRDVLALLPTGMGKSMCYQLPAHRLRGSVVIVSPLLSLMQDQVAQLKKMGEKSVVALNSFLKPEEKSRIFRTLGSYRFIFISPEMLVQPHILGQFRNITISLLVADEAHCISQWGFDFRPDYLRISEVLPALGHPQILALTATATAKVEKEICRYLNLRDPFIYKHPMDRENIAYSIRRFDSAKEKLDFLLDAAGTYQGPGIIYAGTRKKAEELAERLAEAGLPAAFYHGGMEHQDRIFIQQQFQNREIDWVCSTNAFGMGIHVPDVRHVIHFQLPTSIEGYVQEVGRAGRDGSSALATLLYVPGDEALLDSLLTDELPTRHEIRAVAASAVPGRQLVEEGVVRETAYRVLSYWLDRLSEDETAARMDSLLEEKRKQARSVQLLLKGPSCIRDYLLDCFDQKRTAPRPSNCCSQCGIDYSVYPARTLQKTRSDRESYLDRLFQLLP